MTVSLTSEQEEELESVEDISDSDTVVGRILEEDEDGNILIPSLDYEVEIRLRSIIFGSEKNHG